MPRFARVEAVLAEREGAGAGGGPGVHQRHLQHVELLARPCEIGAAFVVHERHAGVIGDLREAARVFGQERHDVAVDLDRRDGRTPAPDGGEDVATAAHADDAHTAALAQVIGQRGDVVGHPVERRGVAVPFGHRRAGFTIHDYERLVVGELRGAIAAAPVERRPDLGEERQDVRVAVPQAAQHRFVPGETVLRIHHPHGFTTHVHAHGDQGQHERDRHQESGRQAGGAAEGERAKRRDSRGGKCRGAEVRGIEQEHRRQTAERRTQEVRGVEASHRRVRARQGQGGHDAAEGKRRGDDAEGERQHHQVHRRPLLAVGHRDDQRQQVRDRQHQREAARPGGELARSVVERKASRRHEHRHGASRRAEHRHRDGDKGEVIPGDDREQTAVDDLEQQRRQHRQAETEVERRGTCHAHADPDRECRIATIVARGPGVRPRRAAR